MVNRSTSHIWQCLCLFVFAAMFAAQAAASQGSLSYPGNPRYTSQRFGEQFGIGVVTATSMAQDHNGFLWIGTQTGLFRYDGSRVTRMDAVEPLVGHYIDLVLTGKDGAVWVAGFRGIARFDGNHFVGLTIPDYAGKPMHSAQALALDGQGNVFAVVENGLLRANVRNPSKLKLFGKAEGVDCKTEAVVSGPDDSIWFTCNQKLGRVAANSDRLEWIKLSLPKERAIALVFDGAGELWLRTSRHMAWADLTHHKLVDVLTVAANEEGAKPSLDHNGGLLVPTTAGLYWRDHGRWRVINAKDGLSSNIVQVALEDSEGTLWVGGYGTGLDHLTGIRDWSAWTKAEGLPDNATWSTARDRQGRLWVATTHGIAIWRGQTWKTLTVRDGLAGNETRQLALAADGSIWALAMPGGITRIDPVTFRMQRFPSFRGENFIYQLEDAKGGIWATTRKNLVHFDGRSRSPQAEQVVLPEAAGGRIAYLDFSPGGVLWATGEDRLLRFDGKEWRVLTQRDGVLGTTITSLAAVSDNEVWLGYDDVVGITKFTLDAQGNPHHEEFPWDVNIIGRDSQHRVWFNGIDGVTVFAPGGATLHFSQAEGLIWDDLSPYGFREEPDGNFLIATTRGLARYVPHSMVAPGSSPAVMITAVSLGKKNENLAGDPEVTYENGSFYAQFTPLLLNNAADVACRYRLAGLDSGYVESNLREAVYSHLPAGSYDFQVQCRQGRLPWNPKLARFSFTVLPPWWQTVWFRAAGSVAIAMLVWGFVRARTKSLDRSRRELERAVAERSAELVQKNRELEEISLTDPLTHARNRRYFYEMIPADAAHVLRYYRGFIAPEKPDPVIKELIFAMVDIDFFKFANDEHGHMAGDQLIQEIATRLSDLIRKSDVLVRWGGEEFLIVCRSTDREHASLLCSRILEAVSAAPYRLDNGAEVALTCSVGWAPFPWIPEAPDALSFEQVIEIADRALYVAKRTGRNHGVGLVPTAEATRAPYDIRLESLRTSNPATAEIVRTENPCGVKPRSKAASASTTEAE